MADGTEISWSEATWNFLTGCTKVSAGCEHCYIDRTPPFRMAHRKFDKPGIGGTTGVLYHHDRMWMPLRWRKPRRIFVNSLSDVFHDDVPEDVIAKAFAVMALAPQHTFQLLTKRHARMRSLLSDGGFRDLVTGEIAGLVIEGPRLTDDHLARALPDWWPISNVHVGVSVESQQWVRPRIEALRATPAAVRWVSAEPLLEPLDLRPVLSCDKHREVYADEHGPCLDCYGLRARLDWVVCGGESGPGARPMKASWATSLRDQCAQAGVAFHFKQAGEVLAREWGCAHKKGGDPAEWPEPFPREYPDAVIPTLL